MGGKFVLITKKYFIYLVSILFLFIISGTIMVNLTNRAMAQSETYNVTYFDENNEKVTGIELSVYNGNKSLNLSISENEGTYSLSNITEGYRVFAKKDGYIFDNIVIGNQTEIQARAYTRNQPVYANSYYVENRDDTVWNSPVSTEKNGGTIPYSDHLFNVPIYKDYEEDLSDYGYPSTIKPITIETVYYSQTNSYIRAFAWLGIPEGASADNPVPAVVLCHGGGGTAFWDWVKLWNDRGYAAIALDFQGSVPTKGVGLSSGASDGSGINFTKLAGAGKAMGETYYNDTSSTPITDQWMYQASSSVIAANSLLSSLPEVDYTKIGITGISWGGVITSITTGYDSRFAFSIPVYGCLELTGTDCIFGRMFDNSPVASEIYDTTSALKNVKTPILFVNGSNDANFHFTATSNTAKSAQNGFSYIKLGLSHSHGAGTNQSTLPSIYNFADGAIAFNNNVSVANKFIIEPSENSAILQVELPENAEIENAIVNYCLVEENTNPEILDKNVYTWNTVEIPVEKFTTLNKLKFDGYVPSDAEYFFVSITNSLGITNNTDVVKTGDLSLTPDIKTNPVISNIRTESPVSVGSDVKLICDSNTPGSISLRVTEVIKAGTFDYEYVFTPENLSDFNKVYGTVTLTADKGTPEITNLTAPQNLRAGDSLPELSYKANIEGTLSFLDGQKLIAGTNFYQWKFVPTNTEQYKIIYGEIEITASKAFAPISNVKIAQDKVFTNSGFPTITYTSSVAGTIFFDEGQTIQEGTHIYNWTFVPENKDLYETTTGTIEITAENSSEKNNSENNNSCNSTVNFSSWALTSGIILPISLILLKKRKV